MPIVFARQIVRLEGRMVGSQGTAGRGPQAWPLARVGGLACSPRCQRLLPEGDTHDRDQGL